MGNEISPFHGVFEVYREGKAVKRRSDVLVFDKTGFSCCAAEGFSDAVDDTQRSQIILVGQEAHVCILQTALELVHQGYQVFVVEDACCSRKATHKNNALVRMQQQGIVITNIEGNSPADKAGLRVGDVITKVENKIIKNKKHFIAIVSKKKGSCLLKTSRGYFVVKER